MKKLVFIAAIMLKAAFGLVSCDSDNLDNERPAVKIVSPMENELVKPGSDIHFEVELSDNVALASYKVNIHGAFDGHGHGHSDTRAGSATTRAAADSVEFIRTWLENDFIVYCTDESGQESFASTEIYISYDADGHDHNH